jgi:2-oxoglutarate ferredoxin oxidoreductase subunit alpha
MAEKMLMKGNEVIAEAALRAGCRLYFGYPITPQTEIAHYMAKRLPEIGGVFLQAESEVAAINMVYGAASTGKRVMTSSSSPGISLKQEGFSYIAGAELPAVVVDIVRCGPGLGGILPGQCDYFQIVKGGGHGDYKNFVFAPSSVQELYDMTVDAFNIADKYRILCVLLGDGMLGQMMESVEFKDEEIIDEGDKSWAVTGTKMKRTKNVITSIDTDPDILEDMNEKRFAKYREIEANEKRVEVVNCDDADIVLTAYGTIARICKNVITMAAEEGIKVGLIRPVTLWPFPNEAYEKAAANASVKGFLAVEMSAGQMVEDVRLSVNGTKPVFFYGRTGGNIPTQEAILDKIKGILDKVKEGK